jgi:hypothetical protein
MRILPVLALSAAALFLAGCSDVLSTEPLAMEDDTLFDAALVGTWFDQDDTVIKVTSAQPPVYEILVIGTNEGDKHHLRGRLVQFGEQRILDVTDADAGLYSIQGHVWIYLQKKGKGIQIQYLDSKWFQEKVRQSGLAFFLADKHPVVTAPTAKLREFAGKYGVQPEARGGALELVPLGKKQP